MQTLLTHRPHPPPTTTTTIQLDMHTVNLQNISSDGKDFQGGVFSECPPVPHHAHALYVAKRRGFDETSPFLLLRVGFGDDTHDNDATFTLSGSVNAWCEQRWSNRPRFRPLFTPTFTRVT